MSMEEETPHAAPASSDRLTRILRLVVGVVLAVIVLGGAWYAYAFAISPEAVRHPKSTHFHFRMQVINGGTAVNFAEDKFQTEFNKDICTAVITKEPFHFHDHLDQFVHVHWAGMTGGLLLKYYGWNLIGGTDGTLGYEFAGATVPKRLPVHGQALPAPPRDAKYYIYEGNADGYREKSWSDFLHQDLRTFFGGQSGRAEHRWYDAIVPVASAHGDGDSDEARLSELNDVLGSVVIFAQKDKPSDAQIKDRFNHLVPLPQSSCGG